MFDTKQKMRRWLALSAAAAAALSGAMKATAATWLWDPQHLGHITSGGGAWTDVSHGGPAIWYNGTADAAWDGTQFLTADFGGTAGGTFTVTIDAVNGITAGGLKFDTAGYVLTGGTLTLNESASGPATITVNANATISSVIAGGANLTQVNINGTAGKILTLTGANTYSVGTVVSLGELDLNNATGNALNGNLTVSGASAIARLLHSNEIVDSATVTVSAGLFDIGAFSDTVTGVTLTGGSITGATNGVLTSNSSYNLQNGAVSAVLAGGSALVGLNKTTPGTVVLSGANTYQGTTTLSAGVLRATTIIALGVGPLSIGGGELQFATNSGGTPGYNTTITGNSQITSDVLTPFGAGVTYSLGTLNIGAQTLTIAGGNNLGSGVAGVTFAGLTTLSGAATFSVNDGPVGITLLTLGAINNGSNLLTFSGTGNTLVNGTIGNGSGGLTISASGVVTLANANSFSGITTVNTGELDLNSSSGPALVSNVVVNGGLLRLKQSSQILSSATISVGGTLDIGANSNTVAGVILFGGAITGTTGVLTSTGGYDVRSGSAGAILAGAVPMIKTTPDIVTLSGSNTFTGGLTINGGTVIGTETAGTPFGAGNIAVNQGTLALAPTGTASINAVNALAGSTFTYQVGVVSLTKNAAGPLTFTIGNGSAAANSVLVRNGLGTLVTAPFDGTTPANGTALATLGTGEKFIVNGGVLTTNGIVSPFIVGQNNDARNSGDFLTYASPNGFAIAAYTNTNFSAATTTTTIENLTIPTTLSAPRSVYALRTAPNANITLNAGVALAVGNGGGQAGLILNNSEINPAAGQAGTSVGFGAAEGVIYSSGAGGSISAPITGTGGLTSFGPSTLFLSGANTFLGTLAIEGGRVGVIGSNGLGDPTNTVLLNAGTLSLDGTLVFNQTVSAGLLGGNIDVSLGQNAFYNGSGFVRAAGAPVTTSLTKTGLGTLFLTSPNAFDGALVLGPNGGTTQVRGDTGALAAPTAGAISAASSITINPAATLNIDNQNNFGAFTNFQSLASAASNDRLGNAIPILMNGGALTYSAANSAILANVQETIGTVTLNAGASTLGVTPNGQGGELNITNLVRNPGATVNFNATGTPGAAGNNGRIILNAINGTPTGAIPMIGGWATVNTGDFAGYTPYAAGVGGVNVVTYDTSNTNTAFASGVNASLTTSFTLNGGNTQPVTVTGSLRLALNGTNVNFTNSTDVLNIESGGIVANNANEAHAIGSFAVPGVLTAGGTSGSGPVELFVHQNQNTLTINSFIQDNGARPLTLIKDQAGGLTIAGASFSQTNSYSGGTILNNSGDVNASPNVNIPGVLGTGAVSISNTRLIINSSSAAVNPISNPNIWNVTNNFTYTVANSGSLQFNAVGALPLDPNTSANQQTIRLTGNSELAVSIFVPGGTPDTASSLVFSGAGQDVKADPGSVLAEAQTGALIDSVAGTPFPTGLPSHPTFLFGLEGSLTTNISVGAGTPWLGIVSGRGGSFTFQGGTNGSSNNTITYGSDFTLGGFLSNGAFKTLTLGNGVGPAATVQIVPAAGVSSAAVQINGNLTLNNDQSAYQGITFVVAPNSTLLLNTSNALGGNNVADPTKTANVIVQAGGTLNLNGAISNSINGNVTFEPGGNFTADDLLAGGTFNGTGTLTFEPGSYITISGVAVGAVNSLTGTQITALPAGMVIRLSSNTTYTNGEASIGTLGLSAKISPATVFETMNGGTNTITTATGTAADNLNLSGGFLTSTITGGTINEGGGRIIVGANGVTLAGGGSISPPNANNASATFTLQEDFDLPVAGRTLTVGYAGTVDNLPKAGSYVAITGQGSRSVPGGIVAVTNGAQVQINNFYALPELATLTVGSGTSVLLNATNELEIIGALTGSGTIAANATGTVMEVGYGDQSGQFDGIFAAIGTANIPFSTQQSSLTKIGAGTLTLTAASTSTATLNQTGGVTKLTGATGKVAFTTIQLNRGSLTLDNTGGVVADRLGGTALSGPTLNFGGGDLTFLGAGGSEIVGAVNYGGGGVSNLNLGTATLQLLNNQGRNISTILVHGTNLGGGAGDATFTANNSQVSGTFAAGQITTSIRPDILTDSTLAGTTTDPAFVTYDPTNGYRALTGAEYSPLVLPAQNLNNNVLLAPGSTSNLNFPVSAVPGQLPALGADTTLQSLTLGAGASLMQAASVNAVGGLNRLNINGGGIIAQTGSATTIRAPFITGANYIYNSSPLTLNATLVNGQQLVKAGPGTLTLGPGAINNADGNFAVNGGTLALGAASQFLFTGTTGYAVRNLFLSGGTLDLAGNSVIVGQLVSNNQGNQSLPAATNGNIISTGGNATLSTNSTANFYGTIGGIGNFTRFGINTTNLENTLSMAGSLTVRGGNLLLTNNGQVTGVSTVVVNMGQLQLDNIDSLNFNLQYSGANLVPVIANRIPTASPVALSGAQFTLRASPGVIDAETYGTGTGTTGFQIASGSNQLDGEAELNGSTNITLGNLVRSAASRAILNFVGGNLGDTGELYQVTHFTISNLNGAAFDPTPALSDNLIGPWAIANGGDWATYSTAAFTSGGLALNARGVSNLGNTANGYSAYSANALTAALVTDNVSTGAVTETGGMLSRTINTLKFSGTVTLNPTELLTLTGGGLLTNTNAGFALAGGSVTSNYQPSGTSNRELYAWINQGTTTISSNIVDNGGPVAFIKAGPAALLLTGNNTYTGGTVISQGTVTLNTATPNGTTLVAIPAVGAGVTVPDLTIIANTLSTTTVVANTPNQIAPLATVEIDGGALLQLNAVAATNTVLGGLVFKNTGGTATPTVQIGTIGGASGGGTLTLNGNLSSTNDNFAAVPTINQNLGTTATALAELDLGGATRTINVDGLSVLGLNIQTGIQDGGIIKTGAGTLGIGVVNANLAGTNVGTGGNSAGALVGGIQINAGTLRIDSTGALGTTGTLSGTTLTGGNTTTVNAGGTLLAGVGGALTGNVVLNGGILQANNALTPNFSGPLVLDASSTIAEQDFFYTQVFNRSMTLSGPIAVSGTPTLNVTAGPYANSIGTLLLTNNTNNLTGATLAIGPNAIVQAKSSTNTGSTISGALITLSGGEINIDIDGTSPIAVGNNLSVTGPSELNVDHASTGTGSIVQFGTLSLASIFTITAGDSYTPSFTTATLASGTASAINNSAAVTIGTFASAGTPTSFTKYGAGTATVNSWDSTINQSVAAINIAQGFLRTVSGNNTTALSAGPLNIGYNGVLYNDSAGTNKVTYSPSSISSQGLITAHTGNMNLSGYFLQNATQGAAANSHGTTGQPFAAFNEKWFNTPVTDTAISLDGAQSGTYQGLTPFTTGILKNQYLNFTDAQSRARGRTTTNLMGALYTSTFTPTVTGPYSFGLNSDDGSTLYVNWDNPISAGQPNFTFDVADLIVSNKGGHAPAIVINATPTLTAGVAYPIAIAYYNSSGGGLLEARYYEGAMGAGPAANNGFQPVPWANQIEIDPGNTPNTQIEVDAAATLTTSGFNAENVLLTNASTTAAATSTLVIDNVTTGPNSTVIPLMSNVQVLNADAGFTGSFAKLDVASTKVVNVTQSLGINANTTLQKVSGGTLLINNPANVNGSTYVGGKLRIDAGVVGGTGVITAASVTVNAGTGVAGGIISAGTSTVLSGSAVTDATGNLTTGNRNAAGALSSGSQTWTGGTGTTGGTYAWKLNVNNAGTPGTFNNDKSGANWDQLTMNSLTVTTTATTPFNIELISLSGTGSNPFNVSKAYEWAIANTNGTGAGSITGVTGGTFHFNVSHFIDPNTGVVYANLGTFSAASVVDANLLDVVINYSPAPEPASFALLGIGAAGILLRRRRLQKTGRGEDSAGSPLNGEANDSGGLQGG